LKYGARLSARKRVVLIEHQDRSPAYSLEAFGAGLFEFAAEKPFALGGDFWETIEVYSS
jgi:hypothetical protein